jgi:hypothetical protein
MIWYRIACFAVTFALSALLVSAPAGATLDTVIGQRSVVPGKPFSDCSARAKNALTTVMQNATEAGAGSGHWFGASSIDSSISATAVVECHQLDNGYAVSFTCSTQVPPNPDSASALCSKIIAAFGTTTAASTTSGASWR